MSQPRVSRSKASIYNEHKYIDHTRIRDKRVETNCCLFIYNISSYQEFKISSLLDVAKGCRKLHTLKLRDSWDINDDVVGQLFAYCPQLVHLELGLCNRFTGKCLETGGTSALRRLYLSGCQSVCV